MNNKMFNEKGKSWPPVLVCVVMVVVLYFVFSRKFNVVREENASLKGEIASLKDANVSLKEEKLSLALESARKGEELALERWVRVQAELTAEREKTGKLEKELREARSEAEKLRMAFDQAKSVIRLLEGSIKNLKAELDEEKKKQQTTIAQKTQLEGQIAELTAELNRVRGELEKATKTPPAAENLNDFLRNVRRPPTPSGWLDEQLCRSRGKPAGCTRSP